MKKVDRLVIGSTVAFSKRPPGSWLSENRPYLVEFNNGESVCFRNKATGGGTYDRAADIEYSEFKVLEAG